VDTSTLLEYWIRPCRFAHSKLPAFDEQGISDVTTISFPSPRRFATGDLQPPITLCYSICTFVHEHHSRRRAGGSSRNGSGSSAHPNIRRACRLMVAGATVGTRAPLTHGLFGPGGYPLAEARASIQCTRPLWRVFARKEARLPTASPECLIFEAAPIPHGPQITCTNATHSGSNGRWSNPVSRADEIAARCITPSDKSKITESER
jgi:hypothetical protein